MFTLQNVLLAGLALASGVIMFQDFLHRLASLRALLAFGFFCICSVLLSRDLNTLLMNGISTLLYFSFMWLMLKLYLYLKHHTNKPVFDELLGWADVLVMLFIGMTLNAVGLVFFFCLGFIFSLIVWSAYISVNKKTTQESIPLAALLVIFYGVTIIILHFVGVNNYVDCSFVNL